MEIRLPIKLVDKVIGITENAVLKTAKDAMLRFGSSAGGRQVTVNGAQLDKETLKVLYKETKDVDTVFANAIEFLYKAVKNPSSVMVKSTKDIEHGLRTYLRSGKLKNYLFERGQHKTLMPYVVTDLKTEKGTNGRTYEANYLTTRVSLAYDSGNTLEHKTLSYSPSTLVRIFEENNVEHKLDEVIVKKNTDNEYTYLRDVTSEEGVPVDALLRHYSLFLETEELHEQLDKQLDNFFKYVKMYGAQFRVRGIGEAENSSSWYGSMDASMMVEGKPGRVIMNTVPSALTPESEQEESPSRNSWGFNRRRRSRSSEDGNDNALPNSPAEITKLFQDLEVGELEVKTKTDFIEGETGVEIVAPMHPKLRVFHLTKMENYWVHVNNLLPYKYKENIGDQLILDKEVKEMVEMLVVNSSDDMEDVIEGKTQSTIIAAVGDPGLGKTLMCEVMSESCKKPLYKVQAAQLGLDAESLENNLRVILNQAQRWNAILMIDEANAYIHARGHDIRQNAIVGVFLRLLDYYRGVLVLTTNMTSQEEGAGLDFDIDPAIISRCTAVIKFELPTADLARDLWKLQGSLRKLDFEEDMLNKLVAKYSISGRTIRNLLKMAANWADHKKQKLSMKHFELAAKFVPMSEQEQRVLGAPDKKG